MATGSKLPPYPARVAGFLGSLAHAWNGLIHTVVHQRNMRVHIVAAMLVGLVGSGIPLGLAEKVTFIFCVLLVMFAEILNSALEQLVDLAVQQFDEKARVTKDAAAAGVLLLAIGTVVIFAAVLVHNWTAVAENLLAIRRQVILGVPLVTCAGVLMTRQEKRSVIDLACFVGGCALVAALALASTSYVFTALTFGLLVVAGECARRRKS
jgi:diacylglycerol kinase (ATP)